MKSPPIHFLTTLLKTAKWLPIACGLETVAKTSGSTMNWSLTTFLYLAFYPQGHWFFLSLPPWTGPSCFSNYLPFLSRTPLPNMCGCTHTQNLLTLSSDVNSRVTFPGKSSWTTFLLCVLRKQFLSLRTLDSVYIYTFISRIFWFMCVLFSRLWIQWW